MIDKSEIEQEDHHSSFNQKEFVPFGHAIDGAALFVGSLVIIVFSRKRST
jgi:hypothetical protein